MSADREPSTEAGTTARWLDSWPDGATYTFTKDQIETVIAGARAEVRSDLARQVATMKIGQNAPSPGPRQIGWNRALDQVLAILAGTDATPTDRLYFGAGPKVTPDPVWSCLGCGRATNHFVTGSLVHPEIGLCERCVTAIRAGTDTTPEPER